MSDTICIDGERWRIVNRQIVRYPYPESPEQCKARGDADVPTVSYTIGTIERVRNEPKP